LPVLRQLEALCRSVYSRWPVLLGKRDIGEIERDPAALEVGLHLFDLAVDEGVIKFAARKGKGPAKGINAPVGSCGMTLRQVRRHYLRLAARLILETAGHKAANLTHYFTKTELSQVEHLRRLRTLVQFDPLTISELEAGLKGRLDKLLDKDDVYLAVLNSVKPVTFLRALRRALGDDFPKILDWSPDYLRALAEGLDHSAKIVDLGRSIPVVEQPDMFRALGRWPMREEVKLNPDGTKKKVYVTRIREVKHVLGADFDRLLTGSPEMVDQAGAWSDDEFDRMKLYLEYITPAVLDALEPLPSGQRIDVLDGLWDKMGREFFEKSINTPDGLAAVRGLVAEIDDMAERGSRIKDLHSMIVGDFFDHHVIDFIKL
jgi:hypothetical protein